MHPTARCTPTSIRDFLLSFIFAQLCAPPLENGKHAGHTRSKKQKTKKILVSIFTRSRRVHTATHANRKHDNFNNSV
jgi:hypothetical protein